VKEEKKEVEKENGISPEGRGGIRKEEERDTRARVDRVGV
jgi:hypothetical protein